MVKRIPLDATIQNTNKGLVTRPEYIGKLLWELQNMDLYLTFGNLAVDECWESILTSRIYSLWEDNDFGEILFVGKLFQKWSNG